MTAKEKKPELRIVDMEDKEKGKALEAALSQIERAYGKGSIMKLGEGSVTSNRIYLYWFIRIRILL